ncbi:hypothetical protein L6452_09416 [Arctium lappa]|uniref:Uncharacterized protein n=1 Tax=Arctium lappa TaxID=4217 RepID=A0ACB9DJZ8_ARCLA|nr:hypothetical protein L6452_09416 [Arctium lappa]
MDSGEGRWGLITLRGRKEGRMIVVADKGYGSGGGGMLAELEARQAKVNTSSLKAKGIGQKQKGRELLDYRPRYLLEQLLVLSSSLSKPQNLWLIWKLVILLSITFLIITLVRIQFYYDTSPQFSSSSSSRVYRRSHLPIRKDDEGFEGNPIIAFLFLVRQDLPLDFI